MLMKHLEESFNMTVQHYKQQQTVLFFFSCCNSWPLLNVNISSILQSELVNFHLKVNILSGLERKPFVSKTESHLALENLPQVLFVASNSKNTFNNIDYALLIMLKIMKSVTTCNGSWNWCVLCVFFAGLRQNFNYIA